MRAFLQRIRIRAAIGLIAAYAIALQTVFAAFAPVPAHAQGADLASWSIICFGSGNQTPSDRSDPTAPVPASGKFHCVLCGSILAGAAILPEPAAVPLLQARQVEACLFRDAGASILAYPSRTGPARAPPLAV